MLSRAGSTLFWNPAGKPVEILRAHPVQLLATVMLLAMPLLLSFFAGPVTQMVAATAQQLHDVQGQIGSVLQPVTHLVEVK
jgi:multicomponent K+:H+ antiporter subunit D